MKSAMQMVLAAGVLGGATVGMTLVGGWLFYQNSTLRKELDATRIAGEARASREQANADELTASRQASAKLQEQIQRLETELAAARAPSAEPSQSAQARAIRATIFLGREAIGQGWVLPPSGATGAGKGPSEAAVVLDESLRARMGLARSETSASGVPRSVTVNHNYSSVPYRSGWWPTYWYASFPANTNSCPPTGGGRFPAPPARTLPTQPPSQGSGIWRPTERPFLPNPSPWPIVTPPQRSVGPIQSARLSTPGPSMQLPSPQRSGFSMARGR